MTTATTPRRTRRTELDTYPGGARRYACLGIVVVATVVLYYQFYLAGAVAAGTDGRNGILVDYDMSFVYYVNIAVVGYVLGALASFVTGVADRYGRVTIITTGLFVVALLCLLGIPLADSKIGFAVVFGAIGLVEGVILVATPALIRDFSPQLGRASAMGFWTLGPVIGSLVVSIQVSSLGDDTPWHDQYVIAGAVGLVLAVVSALFLRELSPRLRDQVMVSARDRALVEARAKGIDVEASLRRPFRQMLKPDILGSAFAISVFLIIYYTAVGFFPAFFQTVFGYTQSKANSLGNWIWACNAGALLLIGYLSDKARVRKPFMVVGAVGAIVCTIVFLSHVTEPDTSYTWFVVVLSVLAVFLGLAYAPWMASFTETVERRNPALAATGLAVWGLVIRVVIAVSVFVVPHVVDTVSTLVEKGPAAVALQEKYPREIATAQKLDEKTSAALAATPNDVPTQLRAVSEVSGVSVADVGVVARLNAEHRDALAAAQVVDPATRSAIVQNPSDRAAGARAVAQVVSKLGTTPARAGQLLRELTTIPTGQLLLLSQSGTKVQAAQASLVALGKVPASDLAVLKEAGDAAEKSPTQWQHYFWVAVGGQLVFIPLIFLLAGPWSPRAARRAEAEHEARIQRELADL
ncbi:Sugar phosphate permease [Jatrophihabitans endophyticus]|uniref:Sugar phosphate permease n=1 Tax=Jatrophihabitans endophyticus TaxID=1206085 RepID=A0A1M5GCU8_9ACTN|nr:MFS transporter [Jatrophihabitans endophyticus]SHG01331.1 Sugar phosphate permease [Jatrophihabitans endophyticus]